MKYLYTLPVLFWLSTIIFSASPVFGKSKLFIDRYQRVATSERRIAQALIFGSGRTSQNINEQGTKLLSVSPDFKKAVEFHKTNNYSLAIQYYDRTLSKWPQSAIVYFFRSQCFYRLNQYERAFADTNTAIQLVPNFAHAYLYRGYIYGQTGSVRLARHDFITAAKLATDDKNPQLNKLAIDAVDRTMSSSDPTYPTIYPVLSYPTMIFPIETPTIRSNPSSAITP